MSDGRETLEGTAEDQEGGLVLTVPTKEKHVFKAPAPRTSLLGLDRLAAQKRAEQAKQGSLLGKRPLLSLGEDPTEADEEVQGGNGPDPDQHGSSGGHGTSRDAQHNGGHGGSDSAAAAREKRHYRGQRVETPSHPGGVSSSAREAQADRERRAREQRGRDGVYADTRHGRDRDGRGGDRDSRDRDRGRDYRDYDRGRGGWRDDPRDGRGSGDRGRDHDRDRDRHSSGGGSGGSARGRSSWESTPSRRSAGEEGDEWEMTPARPGEGAGGGGSSSSRRHRGGGASARDTPLAGGRSSWDAVARAPEVARAGSATAAAAGGAPRPRSGVRFDVEPSPALTPTWQSSSWSRETRKRGG
ncbi:hypothetical protein N2152v2_011218, partial [Parachlorella kessleri]